MLSYTIVNILSIGGGRTARKGIVNKDIVGKKFGSITVLDDFIQIPHANSNCSKTKWLCKCECGAERYVDRSQILRTTSQYCPSCKPPGVRNERLYHVYYGMRSRCYNSNTPGYHLYGGKGVKLCSEWLEDYQKFKQWSIENGYSDGLTIDRIDSNGDYEPSNCRWITLSENSARANEGRHKNKTKLEYAYAISPDGQRIPIDNMLEFSKNSDIPHSTVSAILHGRMKNRFRGWEFHSNKTIV